MTAQLKKKVVIHLERISYIKQVDYKADLFPIEMSDAIIFEKLKICISMKLKITFWHVFIIFF